MSMTTDVIALGTLRGMGQPISPFIHNRESLNCIVRLFRSVAVAVAVAGVSLR